MSQYGYGKRTDIDEYRLQSRAGKGVKAGVFNEQTGKLVNLKLVSPDEDVMLIADNGTIIRLARERDFQDLSRYARRAHDEGQGRRAGGMRCQGSALRRGRGRRGRDRRMTEH